MDRHPDGRHHGQDEDNWSYHGRNLLGSWPQTAGGAPQAEQQMAQQGNFWPAAQAHAHARRPDESHYDERQGYQRQRTEGATEYTSGAGAAPGGFYANQFGAVSTHQHVLPSGVLTHLDTRGISAEASRMDGTAYANGKPARTHKLAACMRSAAGSPPNRMHAPHK